jgi:hypothetical protein
VGLFPFFATVSVEVSLIFWGAVNKLDLPLNPFWEKFQLKTVDDGRTEKRIP